MRTFNVAIIATMLFSPLVGKGQAPSSDPQAQSGSAPAPAVQPTPGVSQTPSAVLRPALDAVQQTVGALNLQKWKRGTVRDEAGDHIKAIQHDLGATLPPVLQDGDASPSTVSKLLPVSRNVSALYDVLLSVVEAARVAAPGDQAGELEQALSGLATAQRTLDDLVQQSAVATENQVADLRSTVAKAEIPEKAVPKPVAATNPCPAPPAVHKPKKPKPAAKPASGATAPTTAPAPPK